MLGSTWSGSANRLQNWRATRPRPRLWGSRPSSGRSRRTIGCQSRLTKATAGREQRQAGHALGRAQPDLDGDAAAHRVADQVGAADVERVHHLDHRVGEPARRVRPGDGLGRAAEAGQVERVDAVAGARERRRRCRRTRPWSRPGRGCRRRRGPSPIVSVDTRRPGSRTSWMRTSGGRPLGRRNMPSKPIGQVDVAARVEQALPEGLDARQLALAQGQPRLGVGADDDVGLAAGGALAHARPVRRAAHLPGAAHVAEAHVVGGVEALRGAEVALGQRAEGLVEQREAPGVGQLAGHGRAPYTRPRPPRRWPSVVSAPCVDWGSMAREIRLHDTRTGRKLPLEPRDPGRVGIYSCGPTVYNRIHIGNARPYVVPSLFKRFLEHEGYETTLVANVTDINDKIYDAARPLGVPSADLAREMTAHYFADTEGLGLGRPDREPLASRDDRADQGPHPGPARQRLGLRGRRRRLLPRALRPRLRLAEPPVGRRHGPGGGGRRLRSQGGSARLRALEGPEGGRGHRLGRALGPRAPGLAHRVLGDGRGGARRRLRGPQRRQRPDLPAPRERGRADAAAAAGPSSRASGCTTGCSRWAARRWPRAWATSPRWPTPSPSTGATR